MICDQCKAEVDGDGNECETCLGLFCWICFDETSDQCLECAGEPTE